MELPNIQASQARLGGADEAAGRGAEVEPGAMGAWVFPVEDISKFGGEETAKWRGTACNSNQQLVLCISMKRKNVVVREAFSNV